MKSTRGSGSLLYLALPCNWLGLNHVDNNQSVPPPPPPVGGIYTVVRSKADVTTAELGDEYVMIGPYNESTVRLEVEVAEPDSPITREVIDQMRGNGIKVGGTRKTRWVGPGSGLIRSHGNSCRWRVAVLGPTLVMPTLLWHPLHTLPGANGVGVVRC